MDSAIAAKFVPLPEAMNPNLGGFFSGICSRDKSGKIKLGSASGEWDIFQTGSKIGLGTVEKTQQLNNLTKISHDTYCKTVR